MTSEIAIMNREGIALAADSAVTLGEGEKTWQSANKIFTLSKHHPVAIMVYGNSYFMGVPWETIVKMYRKSLGKRAFDTTAQYAEDFMEFLRNSRDLIPQSACDEYFSVIIESYYKVIKAQIEEETEKQLELCVGTDAKIGGISEEDFLKIAYRAILEHYKGWNESNFFEDYSTKDVKEVLKKYKRQIDEAILSVFEKLPLEQMHRTQLQEIAASLFYKDYKRNTNLVSGIVIAGFGEKEIFPALRNFIVQGIVNNQLPYVEFNETGIDYETAAVVVPFAQREMVDTFMEGVHPEYDELISSVLVSLVEEIPKTIISEISELNETDKRNILDRIKTITPEMLEELRNRLDEYKQSNFVVNITSVVASLPKTELALMAEALVSLTSLKRKVSLQLETVSGPVDVAIISKGDGFVWIKRKHYFKPELNPHYLERYYSED